MTLTYRQVLPIWWSFFWRALVFGTLLGMAFGVLGGILAAISGAAEKATLYGMIGGYIAGIPVSLFSMKQAISKHVAFLSTLRASDA